MVEAAIVGAGPYGLSIAAHFRRQGIPFRVFGPPMDSWKTHMPKGMMLKSDGFASNIAEPDNRLTLREFCAERGITYSDTVIPVSLDTFTQYGLTFSERMVPELENKMVELIEKTQEGFQLTLETGEKVRARHVVLAVGITHYAYIPEAIEDLPSEFVSHSYKHQQVDTYKGKRVVVIGGGASAIGLAGLMRTAGVDSQLLVRETALKFHGQPSNTKRSLWKRIRHPQSGLGPGLRSRFCANSPELFHLLPERLRIEIVKRHLGPSGHWVSKDVVLGKVPATMGSWVENAEVKDGKALLHIKSHDGSREVIEADHVVAGTGYRVRVEKLPFLSEELKQKIKTAEGSPVLSGKMECSVPGMYFVGLSAANSFGPVMRFTYGADFAAKNLTKTILAAAAMRHAFQAAGSGVAIEEVHRSKV